MAPMQLSEIPDARDRDARASGMAGLRFRIGPSDPRHLEALRQARRAMIREEWTRGAVEGEPHLWEATFSPSEVSWQVPIAEEERCREKLTILMQRANRLIAAQA